MTGEVIVDRAAAIATVTIANPAKRNAIGPPLIETLIDVFADLDEDPAIRTIVLTGAGDRAFSAGFDVSYLGDSSVDTADHPSFDALLEAVSGCSYPTIAKVNAGAYGGAVALAAACDLRIAVDDAVFAVPPAKIGHVYSSRGIFELLTEIGPAATRELLFTGDPIPADRAHRIGLVNHVVPRASLDGRTTELAETISNNAPLSLVGMKNIVDAHVAHGALTAAEREWAKQIRSTALDSRDHQEGLAAFREDRSPSFEGR